MKKHPKTRKASIVCRSVSEYVPTEIADKILLHTTSQVNSKIVSEILHTLHTSEIINVGSAFANDSFAGMSSIHSEDEIKSVSGKNRLEGKVVLIADDDIRNIYSMTTIFENEGAEVICAMDGFEVLEKMKENENISIVLMDIMMPHMDGLQAIKELRNKESSRNIPIIAVTAKAMRGDREICLSAGANDYITKPVNVELLLSQVFTLLKIH
ncbi:MAG: response regulator [Bacteroidetes bacterium]|nr:response regulator [Bacteroidota bacterium]